MIKDYLDILSVTGIIMLIAFCIVCVAAYFAVVWIAVGYLIAILLPTAIGNIWIQILFWIIITSFITMLGKIGNKN